MRRYFVAGNWKMNAGGAAGCELAAAVALRTRKVAAHLDLAVAPPFTVLAAVAHELQGSHVDVAGQNLYPKDSGAFTGEVSAPMLLEAGCKWVILGHSERRSCFGEADALVCEKVTAAFRAGLRPIACIGERLDEREAGATLSVVFRQLDALLGPLSAQPGVGVIAYEPVWAIGTGKVAGPDQVQEVHQAIRARLAERSSDLAQVTRILYGGSVNAENAPGLLTCPDVDGALVGGASLNAEGFAAIAAAAAALSRG